MARKVSVAIVGAGFGGVATAVRLKERGQDDIVILERGDRIGGVWRANTYPGIACDVPSHLYSLSFAPNPDWSQRFSPGDEIQAYLKDVADRFGVTRTSASTPTWNAPRSTRRPAAGGSRWPTATTSRPRC